jgi:hypothetical protein
METPSSFGYWICQQRKALDLTQQALAAIKMLEDNERLRGI